MENRKNFCLDQEKISKNPDTMGEKNVLLGGLCIRCYDYAVG